MSQDYLILLWWVCGELSAKSSVSNIRFIFCSWSHRSWPNLLAAPDLWRAVCKDQHLLSQRYLSCFSNRYVESYLWRAASPLSRSSCSSTIDMWRAVWKEQRLQLIRFIFCSRSPKSDWIFELLQICEELSVKISVSNIRMEQHLISWVS